MSADSPRQPDGHLSPREADAFQREQLLGAKRLRWSQERLAQWRVEKLRDLLSSAVQSSRFHRDRLGHLDISSLTESDLPRIPVMTKAELVEQFDFVVSDPALTYENVYEHLEASPGQRLLGRYRAMGTSGTSGASGLFVYDSEEWATLAALTTRWRGTELAGVARHHVTASLFAADERHISGAMHRFFDLLAPARANEFVHLPASLPLDEIVAELNRAQPQVLVGYPSIVHLVALEAAAGRLAISPTNVSTCGEQCTQEIRSAVRLAWGTDIYDYWGCTEGVYAFPCAEGRQMHLPDDLAIVEVVDSEGVPVPTGELGQKILLTVLYNRTLPLVRYEISDVMSIVPGQCACGCAHRRIGEVRGRASTFFVYPGRVAVHPLGMMSVMLASPWVEEYQVRQIPRGVEVLVTARGTPDIERLGSEIRFALEKAGLRSPDVSINIVGTVPRSWSGKLQHFRPCGADATSPEPGREYASSAVGAPLAPKTTTVGPVRSH